MLLLIFIFCVQSFSQEIAPPAGEIMCPSHHLCNAPSGGVGNDSNKTIGCSCAEDCSEFGNCCLDVPDSKANYYSDSRYGCTETGDGGVVYQVISCPRLWMDSFTRYMCENYDKVDSVSVTSVRSNTTYRNIYCAVCNGESLDSSALSWWDVEIVCYDSTIPYKKTPVNVFRVCGKWAYYPRIALEKQDGDYLRFCVGNEHDHCSFGLPVKLDLSRKCAKYFAPVFVRHSDDVEYLEYYKNGFCLLEGCNVIGKYTYECPEVQEFRERFEMRKRGRPRRDPFRLQIEAVVLGSTCDDKHNLGTKWTILSPGGEIVSEESVCLEITRESLDGNPRCSTHSSCTGPDKKNYNAVPLYCNCYSNCHIYGDCCYDAEYSESFVSSQQFRNRLKCVNPYEVNKNSLHNYTMITDCPPSWTVQEITDLCSSVDYEDFLKSAPVTSHITNITYRNVYCSICNDDFENATSWTARFDNCSSPVSYTELNITEILEQCKAVSYSPPFVVTPTGYFGEDLRLCTVHMMSTCTEKADINIRQKCEMFFAPVLASEILFKNKFCALCNGHAESTLECPHIKNIFNAFFPYMDYFPGGQGGYGGYALLLKIDFSSGRDQIGPRSGCPNDHVEAEWKFPFMESPNTETVCVKSWTPNVNASSSVDRCQSKKVIFNQFRIDPFTEEAYVEDANLTLRAGTYFRLQNNSLLICVSDETQESTYAEDLVSDICSIVSMVSLALKVTLHFVLKEANNIPNVSILALSISLLLAQLLLIIGSKMAERTNFCLAVATLTHYFFLATFCWINVLSFSIYRCFSKLRVVPRGGFRGKTFLLYNLYAWMTPLPAVVLAIVSDNFLQTDSLKPRFGTSSCWFNNRKALLIFFAVPVAVILSANLYFFVATAFNIFSTFRESRVARENLADKDEKRFLLYVVKLAIIMGLSWIAGFVSAYAKSVVVLYLHIVLNSLQGLFILLAFTNWTDLFDRVSFRLRRRSGDLHANEAVMTNPLFVISK